MKIRLTKKRKENWSILVSSILAISTGLFLIYLIASNNIRHKEWLSDIESIKYRWEPTKEEKSFLKRVCEIAWNNYREDVKSAQVCLEEGYARGYHDAKTGLSPSTPSATVIWSSYFKEIRDKCKQCDKEAGG